MLKVQAGNQDALRVIYLGHSKPVYAVAILPQAGRRRRIKQCRFVC